MTFEEMKELNPNYFSDENFGEDDETNYAESKIERTANANGIFIESYNACDGTDDRYYAMKILSNDGWVETLTGAVCNNEKEVKEFFAFVDYVSDAVNALFGDILLDSVEEEDDRIEDGDFILAAFREDGSEASIGINMRRLKRDFKAANEPDRKATSYINQGRPS